MATEKCIGCGYCCAEGLCIIAREKHVFGASQLRPIYICPELAWNGRRHVCLSYIQRWMYKLRGKIEWGSHCVNPDNPWRREPLRDRIKTGLGPPIAGSFPMKIVKR